MQVAAGIEPFCKVAQRVVTRVVEITHSRTVGYPTNREPYTFLGGDRRARDDREIAMAAREFAEGVAFAQPCAGERTGFDQFVVAARGRDDAGEEISGVHAAPALC